MPYDLRKAKGSSAIPMTPFTENDSIDEEILAKEIEFIAQCGSTSITTPVMVSEFDMLCESERKLMICIPCDAAKGRIAVIANASAAGGRLCRIRPKTRYRRGNRDAAGRRGLCVY
ncbi:MAG: dihydrodipicolinate synthase family protein [Clostridiales bacterium]|jgi:dihydrodipicolinate synthase/N-acetylneuraminate lyase|nr:dihydrodipicolinate synthase family protein [Clostridiales bacterium]